MCSENENTLIETAELHLPCGEIIEIESISRNDWEGLLDPCPECNGTEYDQIRYEGGHYGHYEGAVIQRNDYWDQKGCLYVVCKSCDTVLYKSPVYDVLETMRQERSMNP